MFVPIKLLFNMIWLPSVTIKMYTYLFQWKLLLTQNQFSELAITHFFTTTFCHTIVYATFAVENPLRINQRMMATLSPFSYSAILWSLISSRVRIASSSFNSKWNEWLMGATIWIPFAGLRPSALTSQHKTPTTYGTIAMIEINFIVIIWKLNENVDGLVYLYDPKWLPLHAYRKYFRCYFYMRFLFLLKLFLSWNPTQFEKQQSIDKEQKSSHWLQSNSNSVC